MKTYYVTIRTQYNPNVRQYEIEAKSLLGAKRQALDFVRDGWIDTKVSIWASKPDECAMWLAHHDGVRWQNA